MSQVPEKMAGLPGDKNKELNMPVLRNALLSAVLAPLLLLSGAPLLQAETISILDTSREPPNTPEGLLRPAKGMSMAQVEARFGAPDTRMAPVGEPPITRWVYDQYTVYFEHQYVIHSVVHH
jgi:hypothetical protein